MSSWDILSGDVKPAEEVLLFDDNGAHPGMQAAEWLAEAGARLELVTPERFFAPEIGGINHVAYARAFKRVASGSRSTRRLKKVGRDGNKLLATLGSDYTDRRRGAARRPGRGRARHGTAGRSLPCVEARLANRGEVDIRALIDGRPQAVRRNPGGSYQPFSGWRRHRLAQHPRRHLRRARLCMDL